MILFDFHIENEYMFLVILLILKDLCKAIFTFLIDNHLIGFYNEHTTVKKILIKDSLVRSFVYTILFLSKKIPL